MHEKSPDKEKEWEGVAINVFGTQLLSHFDRVLEPYYQYTNDQILESPGLNEKLFAAFMPVADQMIAKGIKDINTRCFHKKTGAPKTSLTSYPYDICDSIEHCYPEAANESVRSPLVMPLDYIRLGGILSYCAAWHIKNKKKYAANSTMRTLDDYWPKDLSPKEKYNFLQKMNRTMAAKLLYDIYLNVYGLEKFIAKYGLKEEQKLPEQNLMELNKKIFEFIMTRRRFPVPLAIKKDNDLAERKIHISIADVNPHSYSKAVNDATFFLVADNAAVIFEQNESLHRQTCTYHQNENIDRDVGFILTDHDDCPLQLPFTINRTNGQLETPSYSFHVLKYFLGNKMYETIRAHILIFYAQAVCDGYEFAKEFGVEPLRKEKHPKTKPKAEVSSPLQAQRTKHYPQAIKNIKPDNEPDEGIEDNIDDEMASYPRKKVSAYKVDYFTRLLPIGWSPSPDAFLLAKKTGISLETYYVLPKNTTLVLSELQPLLNNYGLIKEADLKREAEARETDLQTLIESLRAHPRHETLVKEHWRGNEANATTEKVRQSTRARVAAVLDDIIPKQKPGAVDGS